MDNQEYWQELYRRLQSGANLDQTAAKDLVLALLDEIENPLLATGLLAAWQSKRAPTAAEVVGAVEAVLARQKPITIRSAEPLVDIVGTGGGNWGLFNISTGAAFVAAAAGARVAKHSGGGISNNAGSTDVLDELGIIIDKDPEDLAVWLEEYGLTFLSARYFCPKLGKLAPIRTKLKKNPNHFQLRSALGQSGPPK